MFRDFKCYLQPEALKPGHGVLFAFYWLLKRARNDAWGRLIGVSGLLQLRSVGDDLKCVAEMQEISIGNNLSLPAEKWRSKKWMGSCVWAE